MGILGTRAYWEAETDKIDILNVTIGEFFDQQANLYADREALVYNYPPPGPCVRYTYRDYLTEANRLAKALIASGIHPGEHVAVWATNLPEWAFLQVAVAKAGGVLVTVNTSYRASELEYILKQGDIGTLFLIKQSRDNSLVDAVYSLIPELREASPGESDVNSEKLPFLRRVVLIDDEKLPGMVSYREMLALADETSDEELAARQSAVKPDDTAQMQYTSGTTGFPKGVRLTHLGMVNNARISASHLDVRQEDRFVSPMPFFHVAGSVLTLLMPPAVGCALIPLVAFDAEKFLEAIATEAGTCTIGVPTMFLAALNHPKYRSGEYNMKSLRAAGSGGSPVPVAMMKQLSEEVGADPWIVYGMTEGHCSMTLTQLTDPFELKAGTVGVPIPHVSARIVNSATGETVNIGERGEFCIKGPLVTSGYYKMQEKTAEAIDAEGWLHSGDLATMSDTGHVNIVGRVKDMIIRGGENIFPAEIEGILMQHPKIAEAQVVGVPDAFMGEELVALIKVAAGEGMDESEVRDYCRQSMSRQKVPKYIRFVDAYPLTASGKVKKFELREQLIHELDLEDVARTRMA